MKTSQLQAVVKLGGGAITVKGAKAPTPRIGLIERLAIEIASTRLPMVIVHGGGSFGHPLAEKYDLMKGFQSPEQVRGVAETHRSMMVLNKIVTDELSNAGCFALAFSTSTSFVTHNGRITSVFLEPIISAIKIGCTPVLYGDVVFDRRLGFTILSGDQISAHLALELGAKRLIFALEVDGVYTKDPLQKGAKLIKKLDTDQLVRLAGKASDKTKGSDVTGGMRKKLFESISAAKAGITVCFAGVSPAGNIRSAIKGNSFRGTLIEGSRRT